MWHLQLVLSYVVLMVVQNNHAEYIADSLIPQCSPLIKLMDVILSNEETDALQLYFVEQSSPVSLKVYNISRSMELLDHKHFNKDYKTVIYSHGYLDAPNSASTYEIIEAYVKAGGYNVIILNSNPVVTRVLYFRSVRAARYVGNRIGIIIGQMLRAGGLKLNSLELVGMNLGAHILSFAGKNFKKTTGRRLPVLVALEPSGPCFAEASKGERLDKDDADFVMVIHTNGEDLGMLYPSGHVDVYVNGGKRQPAEEGGFRCSLICSHLKVLKYWSVAVANPTAFKATQCDQLVEALDEICKDEAKGITMGPLTDRKARGIYHLRTTNKYPFFANNTAA